jgi:signal transduction histidine kinase
MLYETPAEQQAALAPFFAEGLARGERCLWIVDDRADEAKSLLHTAGIDVAAEIARGALVIQTKRETYLKGGAFDPHGMMTMLADFLKETKAAGFCGLRSSGEMNWTLGDDVGFDRVIEYEGLLNDFFPGKPWMAVCQYHRAGFAPNVVMDVVLRTHPFAILGEFVCPNLYYEPSRMVSGRSSDAERLDWRLMQLRRARESALTLEQAIHAREAFFSVASHELRTPLAALQLQLDLVARELAGEHQTRAVKRTQNALEQLGRLKELTDHLLDVTQLHERNLALSREPCDLADIVRAVAGRLAALSERAGCSVKLSLEATPGHWDRARIERVATNLLTNAFKFGAGEAVEVTVAPQAQTAVLTVRDQGIGIPIEDQPRIFGPFQRAVSEHHYSGFGTGLWVVQQIVEAHGGTVGVDSAPAQGAAFTVRLPCGSV